MDKVELRKFAVEARRALIEKVSLKAEQYGITKENNSLNIKKRYGQLIVNERSYPLEINYAFNTMEQRLKSIGYEQLIEEVAYTWFNRIIAIRYMEVNNFLPEQVNILSSTTGKTEPDILNQFETTDLDINVNEIKMLIREENREEAYKKLFIASCNSLSNSLPTLFEKINDYTELLLPDYLLDNEFLISKLTLNENLINSFKEVEVIGWLYQYYNIEPKDQVFEKLNKNKKVQKEEIPAVTQFFTPKWIVQYMVENTLGQLWNESYPESEIKKIMQYYIEPARQTDTIEAQLEEIRYKELNLEELKIIDPCVGSGHILVYTFDLLYKMYKESGYLSKDIPSLILEKNLYGVDIDERATQMASFALMMKACEKSKRILGKNVSLNILAIEESNEINGQELKAILAEDNRERAEVGILLDTFKDAKNYGSIIEPPKIDCQYYLRKLDVHAMNQLSIETVNIYNQVDKVKKLLKQAELLKMKYDIAITNPPYMGNRNMNKDLQTYIRYNFKDSKSDLYAVFIERLKKFAKKNGYSSSVTQHSWMFLSSYEKLRTKTLNDVVIYHLAHLGVRAFEDIGGEVVQTSSQIFRNCSITFYEGSFIRLVDYKSSNLKKENLKYCKNKHIVSQNDFWYIPGSPIAYWASEEVLNAYKNNSKMSDYYELKKGIDTGNNEKFLRLWFEVDYNKIRFNEEKNAKWIPYNKGGKHKKWYGNNSYVLNWENDGSLIRNYPNSTIRNEKFFFKPSVTWSLVSSSFFAPRLSLERTIHDNGGPSLFGDEKELEFILAILVSNVSKHFIDFINPTLNFQLSNVGNLPYPKVDKETKRKLIELSKECVNISKYDWDESEISWDFVSHPLLKRGHSNLNNIYQNWKFEKSSQIQKVKNNEEKINKLLIELYNLENELTTEVPITEITLLTPIVDKDVRTFLSYFIGCLSGRYSLDLKGLVYSGRDFDEKNYDNFKPNKEGLINVTEDQYFENDIIVRLKEFLAIAFTKDTVNENIKWLAESLTMRKNESPEERLRRYFMDEFFKDHCKMYQKRPIYWPVDSGKQKGLRTLIYMHRYQTDTMATIRFEHLQEIQAKYQNEIEMLEIRLASPDISASDRRNVEKSKESYQKKIEELQEFDKKLAVYANDPIDIDLDDGVKVNYAKFDDVLAKIK